MLDVDAPTFTFDVDAPIFTFDVDLKELSFFVSLFTIERIFMNEIDKVSKILFLTVFVLLPSSGNGNAPILRVNQEKLLNEIQHAMVR